MNELLELTGRELDAVGGGFLNANAGQIIFNNTGGTGGAGGSPTNNGNQAVVGSVVTGGAGGAGGAGMVGVQYGQQVNGVFSLNGIF
jgi:hypothetical protein